MEVKTYIKKPVKIKALQYNGNNLDRCKEFIEGNIDYNLDYFNIITSEGIMRVNEGDYIIKEPFDKGRKYYPCKKDIFLQTYDLHEYNKNTHNTFDNNELDIGSVTDADFDSLLDSYDDDDESYYDSEYFNDLDDDMDLEMDDYDDFEDDI